MINSEERVIELSKTKVSLLVVGALAFIAIGAWLLNMDSAFIESQHRFNSPLLVHGIGLISFAFSCLCGAVGVMKLFDTKPGLVFNEVGIFDNSNGVSAGLIPWSEIVGFDIFELQKQKMLVVRVSHPEKYVETGGTVRRALNRVNFKLCGSPIAITSNTLKINFEELIGICDHYFDKFRKDA